MGERLVDGFEEVVDVGVGGVVYNGIVTYTCGEALVIAGGETTDVSTMIR
jgi:hypothetical protein